MKGYIGKVLVVDLSTKEIETQVIDDNVYESYLSGSGLGTYMLYKNIPAGADAMGPDNMLGFVAGLLTGTGMAMTGRWLAMAKSPLTGGIGDANCGGNFSPAIKHSGFDGIFFKGISETPVYLFVDNKGAQLIDADEVWGMDAVEAEEFLIEKHWDKKKPSVAVIGQAGENKSLIAGICNDKGRIAARSGVGAVMGSKNLKAVVLVGSKPIKCVDKAGISELTKSFGSKVKKGSLPGFLKSKHLPIGSKLLEKTKKHQALDGIYSALLMKKWGTGFNNDFGIVNGDNPIKNWGGSVVDFGKNKYKKVSSDKVQKMEFKKYHCYGCVIGCGGVCDIKNVSNGKYEETHKPEYETINAFGALTLNDNLDAIYVINEMLNRAGMDSISAGGSVAFAIECFENGILTTEDTSGLNLTWGNSEAIIKLVDMMIKREGLGDILADGVKVASKKIAKQSEQYAIHAGGQEPGMHDPRLDPLLGVHFSADPTPGKHTVGSGMMYNYTSIWKDITWAPSPSGTLKEDDFVDNENNAIKSKANVAMKQIVDGTGSCIFATTSGFNNWRVFDALNFATGWEKTPDEYAEIAMAMQTLRQQFNVREGIDPITFKMHDRMAGNPPLKEGPNAGKTVPIDAMLQRHWEIMGWDKNTGKPLDKTLEKYGIDKL